MKESSTPERRPALRRSCWLLPLLLAGCDMQPHVSGGTTEYTLSPTFAAWFCVVMVLLSAGFFWVSRFLWQGDGSKKPDAEGTGAAVGYFVVGLVPWFFIALVLVVLRNDRQAVTPEGYEWRYAHGSGAVRFADVERVEEVHHVHSGFDSLDFHLRDGTSVRAGKPRDVVVDHLRRELAAREIPCQPARDESWEDFFRFLSFAAQVLGVVFLSLIGIYGLGWWLARRRAQSGGCAEE